MKIKSLNIKNFKSIVDITINEPNPFTVFVGPNGSGKSNIFEALEYKLIENNFRVLDNLEKEEAKIENHSNLRENLFSFVRNYKILESHLNNNKAFESLGNEHLIDPQIEIDFSSFTLLASDGLMRMYRADKTPLDFSELKEYKQFLANHSEVFIGNFKREKLQIRSDNKISTSGENLEKVLKRLLEDELIREEIFDWLSLFIPEFDRIEVLKSQFSSNEDLLIYQKHYDRPFNKELISDGTYNIIALLTAAYQSDEPQFLCIEEPENGLHPFVIRKLVDFFRQACEGKGHYIWLNTHSQTLVECLTADEVIVVDKVEGETKITQLKGTNLHGLDMAEYWLSGATGGGTPW